MSLVTQTVQPFEYVKFGTDESHEQNFDALKHYSCVLGGRFLSKMFAKSVVIFIPIFICMFLHTNTRFCFIFQAVYLRFLGIGFS